MTNEFHFGFSGDDVEEAEADVDFENAQPSTSLGPEPREPEVLVKAQRHSLQELLASLPSKIAYSTLSITSTGGRHIQLTRRELFDVRMQLMAEDDSVDHQYDQRPAVGQLSIGTDDIKPHVYEGGLKSWECSLDLVRLLLDDASYHPPEGDSQVLELGAGTALPTLAIVERILSRPRLPQNKCQLIVADYNIDVLRLVTIPNILLTWMMTNEIKSAKSPWPAEGDVEITAKLLDDFIADIQGGAGLRIDAISGAWGDEFVRLLNESSDTGKSALVIASETIYSPASLPSFTKVLMASLRSHKGRSRALVAAKKIYFGVGGGVDEFLHTLDANAGRATTIRETESQGVARVILEISPA